MPAARSHLRAGRPRHEPAAQRRRDARLHPPPGKRRALCDQRVHRRAGARRGRAAQGQARCDALDEPRHALRLRRHAGRPARGERRQRDHRRRRDGGDRFRPDGRGRAARRAHRGADAATHRIQSAAAVRRRLARGGRPGAHRGGARGRSGDAGGAAQRRTAGRRAARLVMRSDAMHMPAPYEVRAFNQAAASENKIHDDAVAQRFGFKGALVPGVTVFAYMAHQPVARWGRAWLEGGAADCRFLKPVYHGDMVRVSATPEGDGLALLVESGRERCATGHASMPPPRAAPAIDSLPTAAPPIERPKASEDSLAVGRVLGIEPFIVDRALLVRYLDEIGETEPLYRTEGLVHPGQILRLANFALLQNVVLGPWIHVASTIRFHSAARVGEELTLRSRITSNSVNKGHAIVAFDAIAIADGARVIAEMAPRAIWRPRKFIEAEAAQAATQPPT